MEQRISNPRALAERGEKIYAEKFRAEYEANHLGKFVVIDVLTEKTYLGASAEAAYEAARSESPKGLFHLIRIGDAGAFRVSYAADGQVDWVFR